MLVATLPRTYIDKLPVGYALSFSDKEVPWGPIGYITMKRTYARWRDAKGVVDPLEEDRHHKEEWWEVVERCVNGSLTLGVRLTMEEAKRLFEHVFYLRGIFSGRGLWQLGTPKVERMRVQDTLQNCWHVAIGGTDPSRPFCFLFDELMMGGGVGFSLHPRHVYELPRIQHDVRIKRFDTVDVDFIVPDNREGWVELLKRVFDAFYTTGKDLTYSAHCIRDKGAPIRGFGGTASGPSELCFGMDKIASLLRSRVGMKLRPIDCLDICNILGDIVVAGNVRRSAEIAIGKNTDGDFLKAKNWELGEIPAHRSMSNNSVFADHADELSPAFWAGYDGSGEPYGLINLTNSQRYGRIADGLNYRPDTDVVGVNPCGEITLASFESCNLCDIFLPNCDEEQFMDVALLLYKVLKGIACLPALYPETNEVLRKNRRLGIGVAGFLQVPEMHKPELFTRVYRALESLDEEWSRELGVNASIKLSTVKPGGTTPLLPGVLPGASPGFSEFYIRRIRFGAEDPLVAVCREHGFHVEPEVRLDGSRNLKLMVVDFPVKVAEGAILAKNLTAIQQLEYVCWLQEWWSDNSVSVTVYYRKEELSDIKAWLKKHYHKRLKCISFLLHKDHGFAQAPLEEITEEKYLALVAASTPITRVGDVGSELIEDLSCDSGSCPTR